MAKAVYLKKGNEKYYPVPYFPVGSVYLSINKTNPQSLFGGTWQLVGSGKYLMGYDPNNAWFDRPGNDRGTNATPGNWDTAAHVLTINEIPSHNHRHRQWLMNGPGPGGNHYGFDYRGGYGNPIDTDSYSDSGEVRYGNFPTGGGQGHSHFHVSPYYIVCVWLRTA